MRSTLSQQQGFTLVELLVVVLIIGILAAIAVPSFINQRTKGQDVAAKRYARTALTAMDVHRASQPATTFAGATDVLLRNIEPSLNDVAAATLSVNGPAAAGVPTDDAFTVSVTSLSTEATRFAAERFADGSVARYCDDPGVGGCGDAVDPRAPAAYAGTW